MIRSIETKNDVVNQDLTNIPPEYHQYLDVFSEAKAEALPPHRHYDHEIALDPDAKLPYGPIYSLSPPELKVLRE